MKPKHLILFIAALMIALTTSCANANAQNRVEKAETSFEKAAPTPTGDIDKDAEKLANHLVYMIKYAMENEGAEDSFEKLSEAIVNPFVEYYDNFGQGEAFQTKFALAMFSNEEFKAILMSLERDEAEGNDAEKPFDFVEEMPEFPGGEAALMQYLATQVQYPPMALENGCQGKCLVKFVVGKDGSVSNALIAHSTGYSSLDDEALRVVRTLPNFTPGRQDGEAVPVWYTVPLVFKLTGDDTENIE